jgi:hypothetical protein
MTSRLALARAAGAIHRVGRRPDPWAWPDWAYAHEDGTFGNRYDDPYSEYRVLYASNLRAGAFAETLARFRPDLELAAELALIHADPADQDHPAWVAPGVVPREWLEMRAIGTATHDGAFVDVGHSDSLAHLRVALAARVASTTSMRASFGDGSRERSLKRSSVTSSSGRVTVTGRRWRASATSRDSATSLPTGRSSRRRRRATSRAIASMRMTRTLRPSSRRST